MKEEIKKQIEKMDGFTKYNGIKIENITENEVVLSLEINKNSLNPYGIVHGGLIFSLADTAMGISGVITGRKVVTINSQIDYFKTGKTGKLICKSSPLKIGKSLAVFEALIFDDSENKIAKVTGTYYFLN